MNQRGEPGRLEDFIQLARQGKKISVSVELRNQSMTQQSDTGTADGGGDEVRTYLLIADYTFAMDSRDYRVSKVYAYAIATESAEAIRANATIANLRLQIDYERLKGAGIAFAEKFF